MCWFGLLPFERVLYSLWGVGGYGLDAVFLQLPGLFWVVDGPRVEFVPGVPNRIDVFFVQAWVGVDANAVGSG